ncbi:hypothetical protein ACFX4I_25620 [Peribacillus sp. YIM B13472]|uniref:hypothetical protein n=1 Tax=Peribacillus sp. YIM B13472 TaxID=3366297 RepID=UPI0036722804
MNNEIKAPEEEIMFYIPVSENYNFYVSKCEAFYYFRLKPVVKINNLRVPIGNVSESRVSKVTVISICAGAALFLEYFKSLW